MVQLKLELPLNCALNDSHSNLEHAQYFNGPFKNSETALKLHWSISPRGFHTIQHNNNPPSTKMKPFTTPFQIQYNPSSFQAVSEQFPSSSRRFSAASRPETAIPLPFIIIIFFLLPTPNKWKTEALQTELLSVCCAKENETLIKEMQGPTAWQLERFSATVSIRWNRLELFYFFFIWPLLLKHHCGNIANCDRVNL